jgi:hypothetical protein
LQQEIFIKVSLRTLDTHDQIDLRALLDCGATGLFIDKTFVEKNGLKTRTLPRPLKVFNVDGSPNSMGQITEEVSLLVSHKGHKEIAVFEVTNLGKTNVILGQPWLYKHNPEINWKTGEIKFTRCPEDCNVWIDEKKRRSQTRTTRQQKKRWAGWADEIDQVQKTEEENHDEYVRMVIKEYGEEKAEEKKEIRKNMTMEEVEDEDAPEIFYDALDHCHDPTPPKPH